MSAAEQREKPSVSSAPADKNKPAAPAAPGLGALLKGLRRRWLLASFLGLAVPALVVAAVWFGLPPPPHEASYVFHVSSVRLKPVDSQTLSPGEFAIYQQGQKALLTSRLVINAALRNPKVSECRTLGEQSDPISFLQRELKVDFKAGPEYMRLSLKGDRPEEIRTIVEAIAAAYLHEFTGREQGKLSAHLAQLREIQAQYESALKGKRQTLRQMSVTVGSSDPLTLAIKQRYATEALGQAEKELIALKSDLRKVLLEVAGHEGKQAGTAEWTVPPHLIGQELLKDPVLQQLTLKLEALEVRLKQYSTSLVLGEKDPSLKPMVQERDSTMTALAARRDLLRPQISSRLRELAGQNMKTSLAQTKERKSYLERLQTQLESDIADLRKLATDRNIAQIDVEYNKQEIAQSEKIAEQVGARAEALSLELKMPERVTPIEEGAYVTQDDPFKRKVKAAGMGGLGSLLLVLGLIGWREHRLGRIDGPRELPQELGIPMMGTVPALPNRRGQAGARDDAYRHLRGPVTECIDGTRARLIHATSTDGIRVVMVTSAVPREGKTSLATHLAASLARAGHRTLLVDGDLRLPSLHNVFELEPGPGLAEVLRVEAHHASAIRRTAVNNLSVMPAGRPNLLAIQALSQPRLRALIARLRKSFGYVIIDSAPILPVVDSLLIGQNVDGVIISVLREVSQVPIVRAACDRLTELNIRVLGAVLNGIDISGVYGNWQGSGYEGVYATAPPPAPLPVAALPALFRKGGEQ